MAGTAIGVVVAAGIVATLHPRGASLIVLVAALTWLAYTVFAANYAVFAMFLSALVILLVSSAEQSAIAAVENRGFDTLIGGGLAILAYIVWPTWEGSTLQSATIDRFATVNTYLHAVVAAYIQPESYNGAALAKLAASTRRSQSAVMASLQRATGEPARARPDVERYADVLAVGTRIVSGTHGLASHLHDARRRVAVPAAADIAGQLDEAMNALVSGIRTGQPPHSVPDLRRAQQQLRAATAPDVTPADRRGAVLSALLDPLVDAIDTAADLLRERPLES